uniref:Uncharacterized protein n=1 Tax=Nicotiana tabacum TaxID=4097 RepID=A0A1S4BK40_TOBAC|nr:PREDICTED: uncharacterized protein LOC107809136 [Nicotiana tabacum]
MRSVRSQDRLQGFDHKPERTFHRRLRVARDMNNIQALVQFPGNMANEQYMAIQEVAMPSIANITSSIVKPRITGHFELKQSMIQLLHANGLGKVQGATQRLSHHNQTNEVLVHTFIEGLHPQTKIVVDAAAGGQVLEKIFDKINALLNKFSKSNPDWQREMGRNLVQISPGVLELDVVSSLSAQVSTLTNQVNQMTMIINKQQAQPVQQVQIFYEVCGEGHMSNLWPANPESYGDTYNPNWRNHPNFSWGGNQGNRNQYRPQAPQQQCRSPQAEQQASLEEMMKKLMADQAQNTRPVGALPSDTEPNPKSQVNAVTLRNGRALEEVPKKKKNTAHPEGELVPKPVEGNKKDNKGPEPVIETRPPPPFPQRLQKQKDYAMYKKFLDILSQVSVNLPLVEILHEVPKYTRYLRDIVANKRRHVEFEAVALTEE